MALWSNSLEAPDGADLPYCAIAATSASKSPSSCGKSNYWPLHTVLAHSSTLERMFLRVRVFGLDQPLCLTNHAVTLSQILCEAHDRVVIHNCGVQWPFSGTQRKNQTPTVIAVQCYRLNHSIHCIHCVLQLRNNRSWSAPQLWNRISVKNMTS